MHQSREAKLCRGNLKISKAYKNKVLYVIHAAYPLRVSCSSVLKHLHSKIPVGGAAPPHLEHCRSQRKETWHVPIFNISAWPLTFTG